MTRNVIKEKGAPKETDVTIKNFSIKLFSIPLIGTWCEVYCKKEINGKEIDMLPLSLLVLLSFLY